MGLFGNMSRRKPLLLATHGDGVDEAVITTPCALSALHEATLALLRFERVAQHSTKR